VCDMHTRMTESMTLSTFHRTLRVLVPASAAAAALRPSKTHPLWCGSYPRTPAYLCAELQVFLLQEVDSGLELLLLTLQLTQTT
jgi:hypothetical protein